MSISTFNFQFYNYKLPAEVPLMPVTSFSELEMDIDEEEMVTATLPITSTPLAPARPATPTPRYTSELALAINGPQVLQEKAQQKPVTRPLQELRPQLHKPQKRWSMELREKILEMSKRNNASDSEGSVADMQHRFMQNLQQNDSQEKQQEEGKVEEEQDPRSVSDKINFFNKLTNTFQSARGPNPSNNNNGNRFISLLRSSRPQGMATITASQGAASGMPPPKPKRVGAASSTSSLSSMSSSASSSYNIINKDNGHSWQHQFAVPAVPPVQRKCSLRRKPSMEKSRASIARQNSNVSLKPQRHAMMEDLSLVVPVRLRIAEYEQRISMSAV